MATPSNTIILGAGIIGVSTAYYLSQPPSTTPPQTIHLIDPSSQLFASASGFAGGFLAKDWFSAAAAPLGALSFALHRELAAAEGGRERWGYSGSVSASVGRAAGGASGHEWMAQGASRAEAASAATQVPVDPQDGQGPAWLRRRTGFAVEGLGDESSTAQCDPLRLAQFLLAECRARGVQLHQPAQALSVSADMRSELAAVRVGYADGTETDIPCSRLVLAAGAWSPQVFEALFPQTRVALPVASLAGHSLVVRSPRWSVADEAAGCHAVFAADEEGFAPEIFSRIGGEIYLAGLNDAAMPLPKRAGDSKPKPSEMKKLKEVARTMLGLGADEDDLEVVREGLCFRPVGRRSLPIVARISDDHLGGKISTRGGGEGGFFVAAGHGPWGISQSLGTGKVMAELIEGKPTSVDIRGLSL